MKCASFTPFVFLLLFTACQKENLAPVAEEELQNTARSKVFLSEWSPAVTANWQSSVTGTGEINYRYNLVSPQLKNTIALGGTVLAFVKGYSFSDPAINKPMPLPFTFFSPTELSNASSHWL